MYLSIIVGIFGIQSIKLKEDDMPHDLILICNKYYEQRNK